MTKRPYVIVNVAQSLNGFISGKDGRRVIISSPEDMVRVHELRSEVDAILIGSGTVIADDPRLLVDQNAVKKEKFPVRIILDRSLRTGIGSRVYDSAARTIIYTAKVREDNRECEIRTRDLKGLQLENILSELQEEGISKLLVEGGRSIITSFIEERFIDQFHLYIGDIIIEGGGFQLFSPGFEIRNVIKSAEPFGKGVLISLDPYHLQRLWKTQVKDS